MNLISYYSDQLHSQNYESSGVDFKNTAFFSLKLALKGYFSTYQSMIEHLYEDDKNAKDLYYSEVYYESFLETIVHFQHFFELIIKDILERESPLLVVKANAHPTLMHKLIMGEQILEEEYNKLFSIEFSDALKTLNELLKKERIVDKQYEVFKANKEVLTTLNSFRNRIWHRGRFALKYHALDEFIGKYILPFMLEVVKITEYQKYEKVWKNRASNKLEVDVITNIVDEFKKVDPDLTKIALLKEMGRVEISTPDLYFLSLRPEYIMNLVKGEESRGSISEVLKCPVCGNDSLLNHHEYEFDIEELGDEMTSNFSTIQTHELKEDRVECLVCKFQVKQFVGNPADYGYNNNFRFWNT